MPEFGQVRRVPLFDIPLDDAAFNFLQDIVDYPDNGVKARYKRLGMSAGAGNRLKDNLITHGWVEDQIAEVGTTRKLLLRLTKQAKASLKIDDLTHQNESLVHEYWKLFYAQRFNEQGYQVQLEVPRKSGRTDVVAVKGNEKIAIEIETGKSDFVHNLRQNLTAKYTKIYVVATNKKTLDSIEGKLLAAGLLLPHKILIFGTNEWDNYPSCR